MEIRYETVDGVTIERRRLTFKEYLAELESPTPVEGNMRVDTFKEN